VLHCLLCQAKKRTTHGALIARLPNGFRRNYLSLRARESPTRHRNETAAPGASAPARSELTR